MEELTNEAMELLVAARKSDSMIRWEKRRINRRNVFSLEAGLIKMTRLEGLEMRLWFDAILQLDRNKLIREVGPLRFHLTDQGDKLALEYMRERNRNPWSLP